ncbi:metal-dependent hydrolase [Methanosarcina sp.]|uniref:metal-dependent hydrolase n=1 Tax=Methanosarcina sp. TaxID=2213 RepID=UPI0029889A39|nr:metal-dependent hydrolase [Methanosarcina sp.]MDW5550930.1 metal-dependent hydrolase [Methanosarcina sp.]MDW5554337.1 metal-dependent hydrolase [Methanosarcina sp.]MDW5560678.1 metal-dependent hydrolase [Methanosarcina sp.]
MPYPIVHVLFFVFCISAVAVFAAIRSFFRGELSLKGSTNLLFLMSVGSVCALFPDIMVIHSLLVNGTMEHCWVGQIPTHSLLFSLSAVLFGIVAGYVKYRESGRAVYLGLLGEAAFASHLLLDDISEGGCEYLYPLYKEKISLFSMMDTGFRETGVFNYLMTSFVSVFFICSIIMIALFALSKYGFELNYKTEK